MPPKTLRRTLARSVARGVIPHDGDRQDTRAKRGKIVGGICAAARNELRFAMFENQDRSFTRDTRNLSVLKLISNEIPEKNDGPGRKLLDTLSKSGEIDGH